MNFKTKCSGLALAIAGIVFLLPSCSKENEGISDSDIALAQDDAFTNAIYEEVDNMVLSEVATLDANAYSTAGITLKSTSDENPCYTVDVDHPDSTGFPKVITIDYGEGCTVVFGDDTLTRKGQIIVTVTDRWFMEGAQQIVTFNNFSLNGVSLQGTKTFTNEGFNDAGHLVMDIKLENGAAVFADSSKVTMNADYQKEWIRHRLPSQDTIIVTGSASGVNVLGETYSRVITEPLVMVHCSEYHWRWVIVDGLVEVTNSSTGTTSIDFSASGCDGTVIINKNGYHHNYEFKYYNHRHHRGRLNH